MEKVLDNCTPALSGICCHFLCINKWDDLFKTIWSGYLTKHLDKMHWVDLLSIEEEILRACTDASKTTGNLETLNLTSIEGFYEIHKQLIDIEVLSKMMGTESSQLSVAVTSPDDQDSNTFDITGHNETVLESMKLLLGYVLDICKKLTTIRNALDHQIDDIYSSFI